MSIVTRAEYLHVEAENLGKANVNPPAPIIQDNYEYSKFTVGVDQQFVAWDVPENHVPDTDMVVEIEWTCDNATSNGKFIGMRSRAEFKLLVVNPAKSSKPVMLPRINRIASQKIITIAPSLKPKWFIFARIGISLVPASSNP